MAGEQEEKKPKGKPIGGLSRYSSIGGGKGSSAQTSEPSDVQASKLQDTSTLERSDVKFPEQLSARTSKPKRNRQTVYLEDEVDRWIRHRIADTREEISDVVNDAVRRLMNQ